MNTKINSQSTAAVNSAYVIFTSNCSKSGFLQMSISNVNDVDVITFVGRTIDEQRKDAYFEVRISNGISIEISFTKNYFSKKYEISYSVFVNGKIDYDACSNIELDFKVMSGVNVNKAVGAVARLIMEFIEDNKENNYTEISEAPVLDEAPSLDEAPVLGQDDDVERIAAVIKEYYNNYIPSYLDQFGECVITVYWNRFSEADMMMLIENEEVALAVRDVLLSDNVILDKNGYLVYDDGVYLTVDYNKMVNRAA